MNPNLRGRTELPENLSQLFRTITMVTPNSTIISTNVLYQYGFTNASRLGDQVCKVFQRAEKELRNETHYEFGLRAIKIALQASGLMKLKASGIEEVGIRFTYDYDELNLKQQMKIRRRGQKFVNKVTEEQMITIKSKQETLSLTSQDPLEPDNTTIQFKNLSFFSQQ